MSKGGTVHLHDNVLPGVVAAAKALKKRMNDVIPDSSVKTEGCAFFKFYRRAQFETFHVKVGVRRVCLIRKLVNHDFLKASVPEGIPSGSIIHACALASISILAKGRGLSKNS